MKNLNLAQRTIVIGSLALAAGCAGPEVREEQYDLTPNKNEVLIQSFDELNLRYKTAMEERFPTKNGVGIGSTGLVIKYSDIFGRSISVCRSNDCFGIELKIEGEEKYTLTPEFRSGKKWNGNKFETIDMRNEDDRDYIRTLIRTSIDSGRNYMNCPKK